jgi:hypothetical protein
MPTMENFKDLPTLLSSLVDALSSVGDRPLLVVVTVGLVVVCVLLAKGAKN